MAGDVVGYSLVLTAVCGLLALGALLTLPGWALLSIGHAWRGWAPLQRWCLAICLSLAAWPVLFYLARALAPGVTLGPLKLLAILLACALLAGWRLRRNWRELFAFDRLEWLALGLIALTLLTRFWIIRHEPFPAWSDSLHHTLLTALTAATGELPLSLQPYFPVPLAQYHLGLYALSGSVQMLSGLPSHTALLWTAQTLNGLCGLGVYLVLDRKVGRLGAVAGVAVVGLLSRFPAWYVNWGRFTQLASQTLLLAAWLVAWEALAAWRQYWPSRKPQVQWLSLAAALLSAAVFLLHFRVAAFYLPLLAMVVAWEILCAAREKRLRWAITGTLAVGLTGFALIGPVLRDGVLAWSASIHRVAVSAPTQAPGAGQGYFDFPLSSIEPLVGPWWLIGLALAALIFLRFRGSWFGGLLLAWTVMLVAIGNTYRLGIPLLSITNLGAVLIMLYLPIALVIGAAAAEAGRAALERDTPRWLWTGGAIFLAAALLATPGRATQIEPYRYFVTPADLGAMDWIRANTAPDAIFAINTYFWLPDAPHGTDAGYWIPYLTGRQITAGPMLSGLASPADIARWIAMSQAVEGLESGPSALTAMRSLGIAYIYIGARGDSSGPGLVLARLRQTPGLTVLYERDGVAVLALDAVN